MVSAADPIASHVCSLAALSFINVATTRSAFGGKTGGVDSAFAADAIAIPCVRRGERREASLLFCAGLFLTSRYTTDEFFEPATGTDSLELATSVLEGVAAGIVAGIYDCELIGTAKSRDTIPSTIACPTGIQNLIRARLGVIYTVTTRPTRPTF